MKLLKLTLIALIFASCSKEEVNLQPTNIDCACGTIQNANYFQTPNSNFTQFEVRNNCTGEVKQEAREGHYRDGETYCW